mmetsp:Transcript_4389/g.12822  ORF Transcript_4389/g.12822 Transcript_4389/m.12822 type:complete len:193 (+) Transcript_4389:50-628(+)
MAFQRSYCRLQASPHWKPLEAFAADDKRLEMTFGIRVTSAAREDIRQICKYLGLNFRTLGDGSQRKIMALKLDQLREKARAEEIAKAAPKLVGGFFRSVLELIPQHRAKVTAFFVKHYGGEKAWSLGEDEAKSKKRKTTFSSEGGKRQRTAEPASTGAIQEDSESDSEDIGALLGRFVSVPLDGAGQELEGF